MASGSTVTMTGGTDMTQVVAGDTILAADYNNARTNINTLMGTAADVALSPTSWADTNTYGWGQGGAGVTTVSAGELIDATSANGFKDLQDDVQAMCAFLGQSVRSGVGTDVSDGDTISATTWSNMMLNVQDCWNNRFSPASRSISSDATKTFTSQWSSTLSQETSWTFSSEADCRAFFNGGGRLGFTASRTGGSSTTQNTNWSNLLSAMGDVYLQHNSGGRTGSGTATSTGFYELTTSYQEIFKKLGSGDYASNFFQMQAKVNSTSNPTVVTLKAVFSDPHAEGSGALGPDGIAGTGDEGFGNDYVDGTLSLSCRRHQPDASGSGFSFPAPSDSMGNITGS